jgi:hypothetical protein
MYQVIKKLVRPNLDTPWTDPKSMLDPQHLNYFKINYVENGKQMLRHTEEDQTGLERTVVILWESKEMWDEFNADPLMQTMRAIHSQNIKDAGITEETISMSEI